MATPPPYVQGDFMATDQTWPVTSYSITLYQGTGFGWIRLKHGADDSGYIYFKKDPPAGGDFGGNPAHPYIVMNQPIENWHFILDLLRHEKPLYIRGVQTTPGGQVDTFLGTSTDEPVGGV
jgi:hypothetical protein